MSLVSDSISNLIQGVSQQADSLRTPTQLQAQENCFSSPVEGLIRRAPIEHIKKISTVPLDAAFMHTINRSATQRYKAIISDGGLSVFDLEGTSKTVNAVDETIKILTSAVSISNGATFQIYKATGETAIDIAVTGITTATVKFQFSVDGSTWVDIRTYTANGANTETISSYLYMRAIVTAWTSGTINVTATYKNFRYLAGSAPNTTMRALTVQDYTFLVNTNKIPALKSDLTATRNYEALIFVKKGEYGSKYEISVAGTTRATFTTSTTNVLELATDFIANNLYNDLVAWGGAGFTFTLKGSVIHIKHATVDFTISTLDSQGGTSLLAFKGKTETFANLPTVAPEGFVVIIDANPEDVIGQYYVKAVVNQTGETFGPVTWQETVAPGIPSILDPYTMPYSLVREENDTFTYEALDWGQRLCGDEDTNLDPSFVGVAINAVAFFKNRLGFFADENFIFSETGEYFNFFRTTVTQAKDTDPVDSRPTSTKVSILKRVVPYNKSLILFSDQTQFIIPSDTAMTPKTVRCDVISNYTGLMDVQPVDAGKSILFMFDRESYAGLNALEVSESNQDKFEAEEDSAHVPAYIPAGVFSLTHSSLAKTACILTTGDPGSIYLYKSEFSGAKQTQKAFFRWNLDDNTESDVTVLSADFIDSTLYLLVQRDDEVFLEKVKLIPKQFDPFSSYVTCLDRRLSSAALVSTSYNALTNRTTLTLPYDITSTEMVVVVRHIETNVLAPGSLLTINSATVGQATIVVTGDHTTSPLWIGQSYLSEAELSKIYVRRTTQSGSVVIESTSILQLLKGWVVYTSSGPFTVRVTPEGRSYSDYIFTGRLVGDINNVIGEVALRSGKFQFSILSANERVRIVFRSDSHLPSQWTSVDWEGNYTKRSGGR